MNDLIKAVEGLKIIKEYCKNYDNCENCVFDNAKLCYFNYLPYDWDIDDPLNKMKEYKESIIKGYLEEKESEKHD